MVNYHINFIHIVLVIQLHYNCVIILCCTLVTTYNGVRSLKGFVYLQKVQNVFKAVTYSLCNRSKSSTTEFLADIGTNTSAYTARQLPADAKSRELNGIFVTGESNAGCHMSAQSIDVI